MQGEKFENKNQGDLENGDIPSAHTAWVSYMVIVMYTFEIKI